MRRVDRTNGAAIIETAASCQKPVRGVGAAAEYKSVGFRYTLEWIESGWAVSIRKLLCDNGLRFYGERLMGPMGAKILEWRRISLHFGLFLPSTDQVIFASYYVPFH